MAKNIESDRENRLIEAQLSGDILGLQGDLPSDQQGSTPTMTDNSGLAGLIGLGQNRTGNIEKLIQQRQALVRKQAAQKAALDEFNNQVKWAKESDFGPEEWSAWQDKIKPQFKPFAVGIQKKIQGEKAARTKFQDFLSSGVTSRIGSTGAQEEGETATDITMNRPASRAELAGAAAGITGMQDDALKAALAQPPTDPTSLIQPGPGTPASIVNRRTGAVTPLLGTERPSPSADPVMTEYRRLRNDLMRKRLTGVETPAQREQSLQRLINLALTLKKNADPGSPEETQYDTELRGYLAEMNQLQAKRKSAPTNPTPIPGTRPSVGGLPSGWRFKN